MLSGNNVIFNRNSGSYIKVIMLIVLAAHLFTDLNVWNSEFKLNIYIYSLVYTIISNSDILEKDGFIFNKIGEN